MNPSRKRSVLGSWPATATALAVLGAWMMLGASGVAGFPARAAERPPLDELLVGTDDLFRGESSHARVTMRVKTKRWERELSMEVWSQGTDKSRVEIVAPAKEKGTVTLRVENQIWNYLPKVDRTIKVPSSMMSGSWMGSHFTNDDLVQGSRYSEDYDCSYGEDVSPGMWVVSCRPHDDAPVVWGEVRLTYDAATELATRTDYLDEDGELKRSVTYEGSLRVAGREIPKILRMIPADEPNEYTEFVYDELEIGVELDARDFSLQALRR